MLNDLGGGMVCIQHHEIGVRVYGLECTSHCLIEKLLAVIRVALNQVVSSRHVIKRGTSHKSCDSINIVVGGELLHLLNRFVGAYCITQSQAGKAVHLRKGSSDDNSIIINRVIDKGGIHSGSTGIVMIRINNNDSRNR